MMTGGYSESAIDEEIEGEDGESAMSKAIHSSHINLKGIMQ